MKRLNPNTGVPFKRGDLREDGYIFLQYNTSKIYKNGLNKECWLSPIKYSKFKIKNNSLASHISNNLNTIRNRSKKRNLAFNLTSEYLNSIYVTHCPILGVPLGWCRKDAKSAKFDSPSLDRISPDLGYVIGNVRWVSQLANAMKSNATTEQLKTFGQWTLSL